MWNVLQELPIRGNNMGKEDGGPHRHGEMYEMPYLHHELQVRSDQMTRGQKRRRDLIPIRIQNPPIPPFSKGGLGGIFLQT